MSDHPLQPSLHTGPPQPGWLHSDELFPEVDVSQRFLTAMSALAATVTVITAASPSGERNGMTATAVCSLSNDPPMLVACINRSSGLARALTQTRWFTVNLLASNQEHVAATFAGRDGRSGEERFDPDLWSAHPSGAPVLRGAASSCVCHVANGLQQATHMVLIGVVHDVILPESDPPLPLMYHMRRFTTPHQMPGDRP
ncbi:MAG: flavin reductase family protein [Ornithinimicrobium sp.]|uniref:flavin reductase family protein n=1 Tax=Ornithinimicrobium sp. TaxID=1977084 RepID=UPI0026E09E6D|nr:flavin reductase family protein [Ornithinimicrobium sp.]MDO5741117.1 flavin reductase family protein [Ornithinimicrobium sp.]